MKIAALNKLPLENRSYEISITDDWSKFEISSCVIGDFFFVGRFFLGYH